MSGSPLFIDAGGPRMIGALSYGDAFTLNGLGLATPIEDMLTTQQEWPAADSVLSLASPVRTSAGTVSRIRITSGDEPGAARANTLSMSPLLAFRLSGVPEGSAVHRRIRALAEARGMRLLSANAGPCTTSGFRAPYVGGGSLGTYLSLGALSFGGYGTVTYVDGRTAMAFGHPLEHLGETDLFATNTWIAGVWGSSLQPYKVGCPGQVQGALTQDRSAAVGVDIDGRSRTTQVSAEATLTTTRTRTAASETSVAAGAFDTWFGPLLIGAAAVEPLYRLANQASMAGTARTVTTVELADGDRTWTITRSNAWSGSDALGESATDALMLTEMLTADPAIDPTITGVDVKSVVDQSIRTARVVSVRGGPLKHGRNTVTVAITPTGRAAVEVPVTVDIPTNAALEAGLTVAGGYDLGPPEARPDSVDELIAWIEAIPRNNEVVVQVQDAAGSTIEVGSATTDYVVSGSVSARTASGALVAQEQEVMLGNPVNLAAMLAAPAGELITFEARQAGSGAWTRVGTAPLVLGQDGVPMAQVTVTPKASTVYRASWPGNETSLAWAESTSVTVVPPLNMAGQRAGTGWSLTLRSHPATAGSRVVAQARVNGGWANVGSATIGADGRARVTWSPAPQWAQVRAMMPSTARFARATSEVATLSTVKVRVATTGTPQPGGNVALSLRTSSGSPITGVTFQVQRQQRSGWETVASGRMASTTRVWLANGQYRLVVPSQRRIPVTLRTPFAMDTARVVITRATVIRGRAHVSALPPIPVKFTIQSLQAGQWRNVGGWRRLAPPRSTWSGQLPPGRYRASFPNQAGFAGAISRSFNVP
jgi:hypothetical protein